MKRLTALFLTFALFLSMAGCAGSGSGSGGGSGSGSGSQASAADTEPIYIGVIDAFTGDRASNGAYTKEGVQMLLEKINQDGGLLGRKVELVYEDDRGDETQATNAYEKITSQYDLSGLVLGCFSSITLAMEQQIAKGGIPAVCCGSSVKIADSKNDFLYSVRRSDYGSGASIANAAAKLLNMKKVAIIHSPDALGTGMTPVVVDALRGYGVEVTANLQFSDNEKNFAPYIAKMMNSDCDGIVAISQQVEAALIEIAVKDAGVKVPCIGQGSYCQQTAIQNAGDAANGWYSITAFSPTANEDPTKSWIQEYTDKYGHAPDNNSVLTYDELLVLSTAIKNCGSADPEKVNAAIKQIKDLRGMSSTFTYNNNPMLSTSEFVVHIEDGKSKVIGTVKG